MKRLASVGASCLPRFVASVRGQSCGRGMARVFVSDALADGFAAGGFAALLSGAPSTLHAFVVGASPLEATLAAGTLVLPCERRLLPLLLAAVPAHAAISLGWGVVLALVLPARRTVGAGAVAGLAIAALDLGVVARRFPRIRALPLRPQVADHVVYGLVVGAVVARRRAARCEVDAHGQ